LAQVCSHDRVPAADEGRDQIRFEDAGPGRVRCRQRRGAPGRCKDDGCGEEAPAPRHARCEAGAGGAVCGTDEEVATARRVDSIRAIVGDTVLSRSARKPQAPARDSGGDRAFTSPGAPSPGGPCGGNAGGGPPPVPVGEPGDSRPPSASEGRRSRQGCLRGSQALFARLEAGGCYGRDANGGGRR